MKWNFFSKAEAKADEFEYKLDLHIKEYKLSRHRIEANIDDLLGQVAEMQNQIDLNKALTEKLMKQVDSLCHQISNTFKAEGLDAKAIKDAETGRKRREYLRNWRNKKRTQEQAEKKRQERLAKDREYARQYYLRKKAEREAAQEKKQ
jgi:hypothetical protein